MIAITDDTFDGPKNVRKSCFVDTENRTTERRLPQNKLHERRENVAVPFQSIGSRE